MSICKPVDYDRLERLYILNSSLAFCLLVVYFCAILPCLIYDLWRFSFLDFNLIWFNLQAVFFQPSHFFTAILASALLRLLFHSFWLIVIT